MEESDKIVIELKATGGSEDYDDSPDAGNADEKFNNMRKKATKAAVFQAVSLAVGEASEAIMYNVGMYTNLSEDYKTSTTLSNVSNSISKVKKLASTTLVGAELGSFIGGAPGAAIGAVAGAVYAGVSETFSLIRQYQQQDLNLLMSDRQSQQSYSRLGLVDNGRGTEN